MSFTPTVQKHLNELKALAAPETIELACNPNRVRVATYRLSLPGGMCFEGSNATIRKALTDDVVAEVRHAIAWGQEQGLRLVPGHWYGATRAHLFEDGSGHQVRKTPGLSKEALALRRASMRRGTVGLIARRRGMKLVSTAGVGDDARYRLEDANGNIVEHRYAELSAEQTRNVRGPRSLAQQAPVSAGPEHEYMNGLFFEKSKTGVHYAFHLPDGTTFDASFAAMVDAIEAVLDRKGVNPNADSETIEVADCAELRKLLIGPR